MRFDADDAALWVDADRDELLHCARHDLWLQPDVPCELCEREDRNAEARREQEAEARTR